MAKKTQYDWDTYFLNIVKAVALHSSCTRAPPGGLGCVLVHDRRVLVTGYVGSIPGSPHCTDASEDGGTCMMLDGGCVRNIHAEMNALAHAARHGVPVNGATCYCTMSPCISCFKTLVAAGVRRFVYIHQYRVWNAQPLLARGTDIEFVQISDEAVGAAAGT